MHRGSTEITAGIHVYGSRRGYGTLARSGDVDDAEDAALSGIGFGQATDTRVLSALASAVTAVGRALPGGRIAITRALRGGADDAGRPTLRLCTLLFTPECYLEHVRHHLAALLGDASLWEATQLVDPHHPPSPLAVRLPPSAGRAPTSHDVAVADAWLRVSEQRRELALFPLGSESAILALPQVLAPRDALRYRWGVRLLGLDAGADVATALPGAGRGRRQVLACSLEDAPRSEWLAFLIARNAIATPLVLRRETTQVETPDALFDTAPAPRRSGRRISQAALLLIGGGIASLALIVAILLVLAGRRGDRVAPPQAPEVPTSVGLNAADSDDPRARTRASPTMVKAGTEQSSTSGDVGAPDARRERPVGPSNPAHTSGERARDGLVGPPIPPAASAPSTIPDADDGSAPAEDDGGVRPTLPDDAVAPSEPESRPAEEPASRDGVSGADELLRELVRMTPAARREAILFDGSTGGVVALLTSRLETIEDAPALSAPAETERGRRDQIIELTARAEEATRLALVARSCAELLRLIWRARSVVAGEGGSDTPDADALPARLELFAASLHAARRTDEVTWNSPELMQPILASLMTAIDSTEGVIRAQGVVHAINSRLKAIPGAEALDVPLPFDPSELGELRAAMERYRRDFGTWSKRHEVLRNSGTAR